MSLTEISRAARRGRVAAAVPQVPAAIATPPPSIGGGGLRPYQETFPSNEMPQLSEPVPPPPPMVYHDAGDAVIKRRVHFSLPAIFCGIVASIGVIKVAPVYYPKWFEDKKTGQVSKVRIHMAGILAGLMAWGGVQLAINFRR
eukprot:jgi/Mesvir1/23362/Mv21057-RA.1